MSIIQLQLQYSGPLAWHTARINHPKITHLILLQHLFSSTVGFALVRRVHENQFTVFHQDYRQKSLWHLSYFEWPKYNTAVLLYRV